MPISTRARVGATLSTLALGSAAVVLGAAAPASAHVTVTPSDTAAGSYVILTFSVPHGCDGSATTAVAISIPEGINTVTPTRNSFYDVVKTAEQLDPPVTDAHGNELTERTSVVTYTTNKPLPDGMRDAFELSLQLPEDAAGSDLAFPVVQSCVDGETGWTEIAAEGQSEDDLESPAPIVSVTDVAEETTTENDGAAAVSEVAAGEEPQPAAEEASDDDGGNGLAVAGLVVGAAGVLVGGVALARTRRTA
ncbi:hypothetical protein GCM10023340_37770 [Nocardioides marinquilinus]|uniref:YncI copper-binding domain-containing protein n=1 Tax=Nocardioides marinquilinus TaxID=1210400 RepID=A0ABP9PYV3_9ACTN